MANFLIILTEPLIIVSFANELSTSYLNAEGFCVNQRASAQEEKQWKRGGGPISVMQKAHRCLTRPQTHPKKSFVGLSWHKNAHIFSFM